MIDTLTITSVCIVIVALMIAAYSDLKRRKIPNVISIIILISYALYVAPNYLIGNFDISLIFNHFLTAVIALIVGFILFALRVMGGGDIKLIVVLSLWAGTAYILPLLILISLCGGLVAAVIWVTSKLKPKENLVDDANRHSVPYGVAISIGGIWLCYRLIQDSSTIVL